MLVPSYFLLFAALNISAVSANPSPAPAAPPLREIGHVRATAFCADLALHANTAISAALRNDTVLAQTIDKMQNAQLDGNAITRRNTMDALGDLAKELRARAVAGDHEADKLRDLAAKSNDPQQQQELKRFADALGGALYRQKQIANDLNGLLAAFDYHDMKPTTSEMGALTGGGLRYSSQVEDQALRIRNSQGDTLGIKKQSTDTDLALYAATDFRQRLPDITNDEAVASNHALGATSGC